MCSHVGKLEAIKVMIVFSLNVFSMEESGLAPQDYSWYIDLRKYGSCVHSGFGLGFERLVCLILCHPNTNHQVLDHTRAILEVHTFSFHYRIVHGAHLDLLTSGFIELGRALSKMRIARLWKKAWLFFDVLSICANPKTQQFQRFGLGSQVDRKEERCLNPLFV